MTTSIKTGTDHVLTEATGEWAALSGRITAAVDKSQLAKQGRGKNAWPGRDDVIVTIAPGGGQGAPACFLPGLARIEVNGDLLEVKPENFYPDAYMDFEDAPATWGLVTHETAHVRFSTWLDDAQATIRQQVTDKLITPAHAAKVIDAAMLLEEARIEAQQVRVRPADLRWLRASAGKHIVDEASDGSTGSAIRILALVGGRQQNNIILPAEGNPALIAARAIVCGAAQRPDDKTRYGSDRYPVTDASQSYSVSSRAARLLWVAGAATQLQDAAAADMLSLAEQWVSYLPQDDSPGDMSQAAQDMLGSLEEMAERIEEAGGEIPEELDEDSSPVRYRPLSWKPATPQQKQAANILATRIGHYVIPERTTRRVAELLPPGRLRTRDAMRADSQDARGLVPDARPWRRVAHRVIPTPPLRVGIAVDVSGSMMGVESHTWEIVFRFYTAFMQLPDCEIQVWLAGEGTARAKLQPGQIPHFDYGHGCERVDLAIGKLRQKLSLTRRGHARLLIVVSDAGFSVTEEKGSIRECQDLLKSGCRVLWLDCPGYTSYGSTFPEVQKAGGHYVKLTGSSEDAAQLAEGQLLKVMQDASAEIRKGLTR